MFESLDDDRWGESDAALRDSLRAIVTPRASAEFDTRALAAVGPAGDFWSRFWLAARPVLSAAGCSFAVAVALLRLPSAVVTLQPPSHRASQMATALPATSGDADAIVDAGIKRHATINAALAAVRSRGQAPAALPAAHGSVERRTLARGASVA